MRPNGAHACLLAAAFQSLLRAIAQSRTLVQLQPTSSPYFTQHSLAQLWLTLTPVAQAL
jgi:hypothetical protein